MSKIIHRIGITNTQNLVEILQFQITDAFTENKSLLKYAYLDDGARAWDLIRNNPSFHVGNREIEALNQIANASLSTIRQNENPIHLVHLGPGNGIELDIFKNTFQFNSSDAYSAVDISHELLNLLIKKSSAVLEIFSKTHYFQLDMEDEKSFLELYKKINNDGLIKVVAASGEGTLLSNPIVLRSISQAVSNQDYVILSIDGSTHEQIDAVCEEYDQPAVRDFLSFGLKQAVLCGALESDEGCFLPTFYDYQINQLICRFQSVHLQEPITLLKSLKPINADGLTHYLSDAGLKCVKIITHPLGAYGVLCQKHP